MYPWFKFIFRKFLDVPYYWFYLNGRDISIRVFFNDLKLFYYGITDYTINYFNSLKFIKYPFYYWINSSNLVDYNQYRKSIVRDTIVTTLDRKSVV